MAVSYAGFKAKFENFIDLPEAQFNAFLAEATAVTSRYKWELFGVNALAFRDLAIESYIACKLSRLNPEYLGSGGLSEFEVREGGYRIKNAAIPGDAEKNPFCQDYAKLLADLANLEPDSSRLPAGSTVIRKRVFWD